MRQSQTSTSDEKLKNYMSRIKTIEWENDVVRIVDQTKLPLELAYEQIDNVNQMFDAIKILKVRGAPAIGIAAAFGVYLAVKKFPTDGKKSDFLAILQKNADFLASSRPTAVNLFWAIERMKTGRINW